MRIAKLRVAVMLMLWPLAAIASSNAALPDAPLSAHLTNAAFAVAVTPNTDDAKPVSTSQARVIDRQFLLLSAISTATIFTDSYTTTWIGENYRARHYGACTVEGGEPRLYGLHPTVARSYAIGAGMGGGAIAVSYLAKRKLPSKLKWIWSAPLLYETSVSVNGFTTNLFRCNP